MNREKFKGYYIKHKGKIELFIRIIAAISIIIIILEFIIDHDVPSEDAIIILFILVAITIKRARKFLIDWSPLFIFFYAYQFIRGHASEIQTLFNIPIHQSALLRIDQFIFGANIPVLIAQSLIKPEPTFLDYIAFFWYTSFFWVPILTGFILWFRSRDKFILFRNAYTLLCTGALITFLIFPAAPPWMASQDGLLPSLIRNTYGRLWFGSITLGIFNTVGYNPVAPFPSLHVGWSFLSAYFYDRYLSKKIGIFSKLFYLYPVIMCFVVTYTSDHYVIDMLGGVTYAAVAIYIALHFTQIRNKVKPHLKRITSKIRRKKLEDNPKLNTQVN